MKWPWWVNETGDRQAELAAGAERDKRIAELTELLNKAEGRADAMADQVESARAEANGLRADLPAANAKADGLKEQVEMLKGLLSQSRAQE